MQKLVSEHEEQLAQHIAEHKDEKKRLQDELSSFKASHDMHSAESQRLAAELQKQIDDHSAEKKKLKQELAETQAAHDEHYGERARLEKHLERTVDAHEAEKERMRQRLLVEHEDKLEDAIKVRGVKSRDTRHQSPSRTAPLTSPSVCMEICCHGRKSTSNAVIVCTS